MCIKHKGLVFQTMQVLPYPRPAACRSPDALMNWLQKIPNTRPAAAGLEWTLWRKLPWIAVLGVVLPLLALGLLHLLADPEASAAHARWLMLANYIVGGIVIFHLSMVLTLAIGCVIVMVMKGPGYVADGYPLSHSDKPRDTPQTDEEAASARNYTRPE